MKRPERRDEGHCERFDGSRSRISKKRKNMRRLGGTALSLEAFANAKTGGKNYNPAIKKKQREFYKNAKYVNKYKKSLKQQSLQNDISSAAKPVELFQVRNETRGGNSTNKRNNMKKKLSLEELYEKKREEEEKARMEREEMLKAKREGRAKAEARRKASREKMFKKTRHGQPVMKYRIEHLLDTIQNSANKNK